MVYISLGSNLGNRISNLRKAIDLLKDGVLYNHYDSIVIETKAILKENSPASWNKPYLNMVIVGDTNLSPRELLNKLWEIEKKVGRVITKERWAPRVIDLDILLYDSATIQEPDLCIPHLELLNRDFLLHLLAMMPKQYMPMISLDGNIVSAAEYAKDIPYKDDLFERSFIIGPQIVGILNITQDSFSDGGKYLQIEEAVIHAHKLIQDGAEIIDIGAQSTKPGAKQTVGPMMEYERISRVLEAFSSIDVDLSIDTYHPEVIKKILGKYKISFINDVSGNLDDTTLHKIAASKCKIISMHSLSIPPNKYTVLPYNVDVIDYLNVWSKQKLTQLINCGFNTEQIVLDPGIGFGKSLYQNLELIRSMKKFRSIGCKTMIGHSRKGFINAFYKSLPLERDLETAVISCSLIDTVDYIRVHSIQEHYRIFVAKKISQCD